MKTKHHLFSHYQVRKALVSVFGEPKTEEEHNRLHAEMRKVRKAMPTYDLNEEQHKRLHETYCEHCGRKTK